MDPNQPAAENPYETPRSALLPPDDSSSPPAVQRTTLVGKFGEAIHLLTANFLLLGGIILTVAVPEKLLTNYLIFYVYSEDEVLDATGQTMWIEAVFCPISIAAMLQALAMLKRGQRPTYAEAMAVGFRWWIPLLVARFVAGLLIVLGFIALIVPGIILSLQYAQVDAAVVLEGLGVGQSRKRSAQLTAGVRGQILLAAVLFFIAFVVLTFVVYLPLGLVPQLDNAVVSTVLDCGLDLVFAVLQIVIFLFYWEAAQPERVPAES